MIFSSQLRYKQAASYGTITRYEQLVPENITGACCTEEGQTPQLLCRIQVELFSLRSQLLGESPLVSFLPLNNMLKFGGLSYRFDSRVYNRDTLTQN